MDLRPNHTLYINNLNDKIPKVHLRKALYYLFCQYGRILDIIAMKTMKMRGQAFVIFRDIAASTNALRSLQGYSIFEKPIRIQYARQDSTQIARIKGQSQEAQRKKDEEREKRKKKKTTVRTIGPEEGGVEMAGDGGTVASSDQGESQNPPHHILFISNLPAETTSSMLSMLFGQFQGFREVRQVAERTDIAFVEFDTETNSSIARNAYNGFKLTPTNPMKIEFSKK